MKKSLLISLILSAYSVSAETGTIITKLDPSKDVSPQLFFIVALGIVLSLVFIFILMFLWKEHKKHKSTIRPSVLHDHLAMQSKSRKKAFNSKLKKALKKAKKD